MIKERILVLIFFFMVTNLTFSQDNKVSTATTNVVVLENHVYIPYSCSSRTIRVYTPPGYAHSDKRYPVIYMLDGQNLFDRATSYAGEWGVDETMDEMAKDGIEAIVVGIDNHGVFRMQEYNVYDHERFGPQQGKNFTQFLVEELKPMIDDTYRTLSDVDNTTIVGSSMGGLMAYYAIMVYPETFSKAGVYSPSFWVSEDIYSIHKENDQVDKSRIYMIVGSKEPQMIPFYNRMKDSLINVLPLKNFYTEMVPEGGHNEAFWRGEFSKTVKWFFAEGK